MRGVGRSYAAVMSKTVTDVRVATDCAALLSGRGSKTKLGLIRERVASAYNRYLDAINAAARKP